MKFQHILSTGERAMMFILFGEIFVCFPEQIIVRLSKPIWIKRKLETGKGKMAEIKQMITKQRVIKMVYKFLHQYFVTVFYQPQRFSLF